MMMMMMYVIWTIWDGKKIFGMECELKHEMVRQIADAMAYRIVHEHKTHETWGCVWVQYVICMLYIGNITWYTIWYGI